MAVGDKKPVVMGGDIGKLVPPNTHASQHASGGADPITPSMIGAVTDSRPYISGVDILEWAAAKTAVTKAICGTEVTSMPFDNSYWFIDLEYAPQGVWRKLTATNVITKAVYENILNNSTWTGWGTAFATTDYAVNKAGDTMTGNLILQKVDNQGYSVLMKAHDASADYGTSLEDTDANGNVAKLKLSAYGQNVVFGGNSADYAILHTGNKPSGSYTGNGDATSRTIDTGGIGNACMVYGGANEVVYATPLGSFYRSGDSVLYTTTIAYDGALHISSNSIINTNGYTYYYQVL